MRSTRLQFSGRGHGSVLSNRPWISSAELAWISFAGLSHVPKADGAAEVAAARCVHDPLSPR
jgi:hypothetical protein